ncbi:MAG: nicotinate-nucleotide diphosphorylase (carboxylating) [Lysobacterales bacterium 13-68-4]|jgi:nicotinate-nucleotide pyrophosphorylase (carboxylating)|nr:MAG: nicotinate-nucleotide diphosphorylase (carboxylating) [Xanthomonadales bacterium 15-68-25]OZB67978.1 MAG: nicotinate-nucleotide diphosphorylase (carboxylating) [Xanthomonadales bacterium 14-68-21]OZB70573.1 MAG: nicotinate-nucleotide diphosphorylase (carboxylating) [Xanthomonadales bacterium 13-68-4]
MTQSGRFTPPSREQILSDIERAFAEDVGAGDATAELLSAEATARATLTCREPAVLAGRPWFDACFRARDPGAMIEWFFDDGDAIPAGAVLCRVSGFARALVTAERSALNFLQLLSGTATTTAAFAAALAGTGTRLLDTRKTVPGLRLAQKYAVRCGGGVNHRVGLYDGILVKENHIIAAGGIGAAVASARQLHPGLPLEVEVESLDELDQALAAGVDRVMLDNFDLPAMREAVRIAGGRVPLEVSGNVELATIREIAATGVDFVSVGALTKHVRAIDLSLRLHLD